MTNCTMTTRTYLCNRALPPELQLDIHDEPAEMKILLAIIQQAHVDARRTTPVSIEKYPEFGDPQGLACRTLRTMHQKGWVVNAHGRWRAAVSRDEFADALRRAILEVQDV